MLWLRLPAAAPTHLHSQPALKPPHPNPPQPTPTRPTPAVKGRVLAALAEADKALVDGSDEFLQLLRAASRAQRALCGTA